VGLNIPQLRQALDTNEHQATIEAQQNLARSLGAGGTPTFFINGRNLRGAQPLAAFKAVIDEELTKARARVAAGTPRARLYEAIIANGATTQQMIGAPGGGAAAPEPAAPDADRVYDLPVPRTAPTKGPANARVTIQLFSDFQCPFCSRINPTLEQIAREYPTQVRIVWRDYPLPMHPNAMPAAEAAREVFRQGGAAKFWAFHALLFQNQQDLTRETIVRLATQVGGINIPQLNQALDAHTHQAAVQADVEAVSRAGAQIGTPSSFINGRLLQGAVPYEMFKQAIDRALAGGAAAPRPAAH
jgi:protein-disulfide isomerase